MLGRLYSTFIRPHRLVLFAGIFFSFVASLMSAAQVRLVQPAIDNALEGTSLRPLLLVIGAIVVVTFLRALAGYLRSLALGKVGFKMVQSMQGAMLERILRADISYLESSGPALQVSRFTNNVYTIKSAVTDLSSGSIGDAITLIAMLGIAFSLNWKLALLALLLVPVAVLFTKYLGRYVRLHSRKLQAQLAHMVANLQETLQGALHIKANNATERVIGQNHNYFRSSYRFAFKNLALSELGKPVNRMLSGTALAVVLLIGGYQVLHHGISVGELMTFFLAIASCYTPLNSLQNVYLILQRGKVATENIFEILDVEPHIVDAPSARPLAVTKGGISVRNVSLRMSKTPILHDISINIPGRSLVAFVGKSGAGKTTLLKLLDRFYDPDAGEIAIDGQDFRSVTLQSLRKHVAYVPQTSWLISGSILANLRFADPKLSEASAWNFLAQAALKERVQKMPKGIHTPVGESGISLSGGEKQRLAIAQALVRRSDILLMDEATSALDSFSEQTIYQALGDLRQSVTIVVVAHRLATVTSADHIFVMDHGRIVQNGNHASLVKTEGLYRDLVRRQSFLA